MKKACTRRRSQMTLLEIMIVIFIIGIISSVIGYNMKGSLEKAKAFRTKEGIKKIGEIFELEMAEGVKIEQIHANPEAILKASGLVSNPKEFLKDGWGQPYEISLSKDGKRLGFHSSSYEKFLSKQNSQKKEALKLDEEDNEG